MTSKILEHLTCMNCGGVVTIETDFVCTEKIVWAVLGVCECRTREEISEIWAEKIDRLIKAVFEGYKERLKAYEGYRFTEFVDERNRAPSSGEENVQIHEVPECICIPILP